MLRLIVLSLFLLNVAYYAWAQGWLLPYGWGPMQQRETQRVVQQINPDALVLHKTQEAPGIPVPNTGAVASAALGDGVCLQSGNLDAAQATALRPVLEANLPKGTWTLDEWVQPMRWMIYMGKYPSSSALVKKRTQLEAINVKTEVITNPALSPGLSLGSFASQDEANAALQTLTRHGVRTAKILQEPLATPVYRLRLPGLTPAQIAPLAVIRAALPSKSLQDCAMVEAK